MLLLSASFTSLAYLIVSLLQGYSIFSKTQTSHLKTKVLGIALIAIIAHIHILASQLWTTQGIVLNVPNIISLASFCFVSIITLSSLHKPVINLFVFFFPIAAISVLTTTIWNSDHSATNLELGMIFHIIISIIAYSALMISAVQAIFLWVQNHQLKNNISGKLSQLLPSLQSMERLLFDLILMGFLLLSLSILSGVIFRGFIELTSPEFMQKMIFTLIAWIIYLALLLGHLILGWRGVVASKLTITGFIFILIAIIGTKLLFN